MHAVERNEAAVWVHAVPLVPEILRRVAKAGRSPLRLHAVLAQSHVGDARLKLCVILLRSLECVGQSDDNRSAGRSFGADELEWRAGRDFLGSSP
jgi:hypothetical protein